MNLKGQVIAINKLLSDIYKRDMRLSYLLAELDFNCEEIELINRKLLPNIVNIFLEVIEATIVSFSDGKKQFKIIKNLYGLSNGSQGLRDVGAQLDISHERVRQLKNKAFKKLVSKNNEFDWQSKLKQQVKELIDNARSSQQSEQNINSRDEFNFQLSLLPNGEQCLTISKDSDEINITEFDFPKFYDNLLHWMELLGWDNFPAYKIADIRKQFPRAYEKWTKEEEELLKNYLAEGLSVKEIANLLERQLGAISSRMIKLGLSNQS